MSDPRPSGSEPAALEYARLAERQRALAEALLSAGVERLDWPAQKLATHRRRRLRDLVGHARARSAWHAERMADLAVEALDEAGIGALPPMTRGDLRAGWDRIAVDPQLRRARCEAHLAGVDPPGYLDDRYHVVTDGADPPGVFVYAWDAWATLHVGHLRSRLRRARRRRAADPRESTTAWVGLGPPGDLDASRFRTFGGPRDRAFPASLPLDALVAGLDALRPDAILGDARCLERLAREALEGRMATRPREVVSSGAPPGPGFSEAVGAAWDVDPLVVCASAAVGPIAASCGEAPGLHVNDDELMVEPVDAAGRPCAPGAPSARIYATPLFQRSLPLIRYEVTEVLGSMAWLEPPCPCGSAFRRIQLA